MVQSSRLTDYQAQYLAYELTKRCSSDKLEKLASTFAGAQVDLNPHQVDAALFSFSSPLSKGALLADEVGLGKTIEAGLVISQKWAERRRRILVLTPSNLRKQWLLELSEKFFLPGKILETRSYKAAKKAGNLRPFDGGDAIAICSYQFARNKEADVTAVPWDLVVIDEAHRLRNVYKSSSIISKTLRRALKGRQKLLLTATPLQNSLLELYGLISFIDELAFGDVRSFKAQFAGNKPEETFAALKARLKPLCNRTLRSQVTAYVPYTKRHALVEEFTPEAAEEQLYHLVSDYLQRENLQALPASQRSLMTLVLRKLLASSTFAIAGALNSIAERLRGELENSVVAGQVTDVLDADYEALDETAEEWEEEAEEPLVISASQRAAMEAEIKELEDFAQLAVSIDQNAKGKALLKALAVALKKTEELGGAQKAIIFTESRRTQDYLLQLLGETPWCNGILLFNGSNTDDKSKQIYNEWKVQHAGSDRATGSRTADMRSALVDYFREQGSILIATEAAAEGINLQFCSLVINYDLPWNPQRIEQRIGRCHRYGQKHDVVVVNFLNRKNAADKRVFELLSEKFQLFDGVFGSSDEVLGAIGSGVDFEKRISQIYQGCRKPEEIESAFDALQQELSQEIDEAMTQTRQKLLENFDDDVREKLKSTDANSKEVLNRFEKSLMQLTAHELRNKADFQGDHGFCLREIGGLYGVEGEAAADGEIPLGLYELPRRSQEAHTYRLGHPLAEVVIAQAMGRELPVATVRFDYDAYAGKISVLELLRGQSGVLALWWLTVEALEQAEDYLIFAAETEGGERLAGDVAEKLMALPGKVIGEAEVELGIQERLMAMVQGRQGELNEEIMMRNGAFFEAEVEKLDAWADDRKVVLEREIKEFDGLIKEAKREATRALDLAGKLVGQRKVKDLEKQRNVKRRSLFDAQDEVDAQRDGLIEELSGKLEQESQLQQLFVIRWQMD